MAYLRQRSSNVADFRRVPLPESEVQLVVGHQASALPVGELTSSSSIGKRQYTRRTAVEFERTRFLGLVKNGGMLIKDRMLL